MALLLGLLHRQGHLPTVRELGRILGGRCTRTRVYVAGRRARRKHR